jgi:bifunctional non-homologous end joining protein LigD
MLARESKRLPGEPGWAFEVKWDGIRALLDGAAEPARLQSRRGESITQRYPELSGLVALAAAEGAVLDGEIVALGPDGKPSFQLLQRRIGVADPAAARRRAESLPATYLAFDLLALGGEELTARPYEERRAALLDLGLEGERWRTPAHHVDEGPALLEAARRQGLEGVVAKRLGSPYRPGIRSFDWLKVRIRRRGDFLIGGWLPGEGIRGGSIGALLLGFWDRAPDRVAAKGEPQRLVYAGAVGSGLSGRSLEQLARLLEPLRRDRTPFELGGRPRRAAAVWCEPRLVCAVEFSEWTREGTLRQPAYKGLRDDVEPASVLRAADEFPRRPRSDRA